MSETLRTIDGRPSLRIERWLNHPVERVWRAITEPDELSQWYPFKVTEMDFQVGGRMVFDDGAGMTMEATIVELQPPHIFAVSEHAPPEMTRESDDLVHIELRAEDGGCLLIFTHTFDDRPAAASYAAGWEACLGGLEMMLDEKPGELTIDWGIEHERYIRKFGLDEGVAESDQDGWRIRFERQLTRTADDVWTELIALGSNGDPPAVGECPPEGFRNAVVSPGRVTELDAPNVVEYEWLYDDRPAGRVRWELTDGAGIGARLNLTQTGPDDREDERAAAMDAWRSQVERLARRVAESSG